MVGIYVCLVNNECMMSRSCKCFTVGVWQRKLWCTGRLLRRHESTGTDAVRHRQHAQSDE